MADVRHLLIIPIIEMLLRNPLILFAFMMVGLLLIMSSQVVASSATKPHVLMIIVDDLGWAGECGYILVTVDLEVIIIVCMYSMFTDNTSIGLSHMHRDIFLDLQLDGVSR